MKSILRAAVAALSLLAALPAHAGEGNGEPFPFKTPGWTTMINPQPWLRTPARPPSPISLVGPPGS